MDVRRQDFTEVKTTRSASYIALLFWWILGTVIDIKRDPGLSSRGVDKLFGYTLREFTSEIS